ncbi:MAG: hypothetical protein IJ448_00165 [Oscillospiraceae bacterium]|nr:hypothetical protein [Oscillospiraceae bacterium]
MKAMTKKLLALLLTLVLCLGMFAGCVNEIPTPTPDNGGNGGTNGNIPIGGDTTPNTEIYPLKSDKVFTIATKTQDMNDRYFAQLWEEVTGVEVEYVVWDKEQVKLALAGKTLPDAFFATTEINKATAYEYGSAGYFVNFMDYLEYMPNFCKAIEEYPDTLTFVQNEDGSVYCLPRLGTTATTHNVMYVRTDMLKAAGWNETPKTTEDFLKCIKDLQAHYGAQMPDYLAFDGYKSSYMTWNGTAIMAFFFPSFGELLQPGFTVSADGKNVVLGAATEQYKHLMEFMYDVYHSGAFSQDVYTKDGTSSKALAAANKVAISPYMSFLTGDNFASGDIRELSVLEPLTSAYYDKQHYYARSNYTWHSAMINASLPEEDIITLVRWFDSFYATESNPLTADGNVWGLSAWLGKLGTDWVKNEEENTYEVLPHEGFDSSSNWVNTQGSGTQLYLGEFMYIEQSGTGLMIKGEGTVDKLWPHVEAPAFDISMLTLNEEENNIYSDYWTDINKYIGEETAKFITGQRSIEAEWDQFVTDLYALGLQDVLDAYQSAYDRQMKQ